MQFVPQQIKERIRQDILNREKGIQSVSIQEEYIEVIVSPNFLLPSAREVMVDGNAIPIRYVRGKVYSLNSLQLMPYMRAYQSQVQECRTCIHETLRGGISIAHRRITAGTLGTFVFLNEDSRWAILSNNHVLANANDAAKGDDIVQPGPSDSLNPRVVAKLERFVPIKFLNGEHDFITPGNTNSVDAAVGRPLEGISKTREIMDIGFPQGTRPAFVGQTVKKSGRTSGLNTGVVKSTNVSIKVNYGTDINPIYAIFGDLIEMGPMILPGDSGSLLVDSAGYAIGLVFAGSFDTVGTELKPISSYACKISNVLRQLNCTMLRASTTPQPTAFEDVEYPSAPVYPSDLPITDLAPFYIVGAMILGAGMMLNFKFPNVIRLIN